MLDMCTYDMLHEKKNLYILKEQHNVECICVLPHIFFYKEETKATHISSAINKKLIRLVKI